MLRLAALLLLVAAPALAAVPAMDSQSTCEQLSASTAKPELLPRCLADEAAALARIEPHWDAVPMDIAGGCASAVLDQGAGSYQILAICIEDGLSAAGLPSPFPPSEVP